jgi:hypothetical protein
MVLFVHTPIAGQVCSVSAVKYHFLSIFGTDGLHFGLLLLFLRDGLALLRKGVLLGQPLE